MLPVRFLGGAAVLTAVYVAAAKLGIEQSVAHGVVTPIWAPTGIALAALLIFGYRLWPAVALGAFVANGTSDVSWAVAGSIAAGNTLEAVAGTFLLRRIGFRSSLGRVRDVLGLVVLAAALSTTVSATNGVTTLWVAGLVPASAYGSEWLLWWFGDAMGDLLVAPFLLVWASSWRQTLRRGRLLEGLALLALVPTVSWLVFVGGNWRYPYLLFPLLIWATLRFAQAGAVTATLAVAAIALWGALSGLVPIGGASLTESVQILQALVGVVAITLLVLAAVLEERTRAEDDLRQSKEHYQSVLGTANDAFVEFDTHGTVTDWNRAAEATFGWSRAEVLGRSLVETILPGGRLPVPELFAAGEGGAASRRVEVTAIDRRGREFPVEVSVWPVEAGHTVRFNAFVQDITERRRAEEQRRLLASETAARAEAEAASARLRHLQGITEAALSYVALEELLPELLERICSPLRVDAAAVLLLGRDELLAPAAAKGLDAGTLRDLRWPLGEGFSGVVAAGRRTVVLDDVLEAGMTLDDPPLLGNDVRSLVALPLSVDGRSLGVLQVGALGPRHFGEDDVRFLQLAADRVAFAIERTRLYEQQQEVAEALQRSLLLEDLPSPPGLDLAASYLPATTAMEVGGDWYDAIELDEGRLLLAVGDVVGHGLEAARAMGQLRNALRAYAFEDPGPAAVLARLSSLVTRIGLGDLTTLALALVDPSRSRLELAGAGHPPPLIVPPGGPAEFVEEARGFPLGVRPYDGYGEATVALEPGSVLVLYTDGLVERRGESLDAGLERLAAATAGGGDPRSIRDRILERLLAHGDRQDDIALVVCQVVPVALGRLALAVPAEPASLQAVRQALGVFLRTAGADPAEAFEIQVACGEACSNAIEHAYGPGDSSFEVEATRAEGVVAVVVRDFGKWREPRGTHRGLGLLLMEELMDGVSVARRDSGTEVRLDRRLRNLVTA